MPRTLLIIAPLAAILVAVAAMLLAGSGGRSPVPTPAPIVTPSAAPSVSPSPSTTPGPSPYPLAPGEAWIVLGGEDRATLIRPDGTGQHEILVGIGVSVTDPVWSPDGQKVAFGGGDDRGSQLWVANADGTGAHAVTSTPPTCPNGPCDEAIHPAWSPDGKTIAYIDPQHDGGTATRYSIMLLDVATGATTEAFGTAEFSLARPTWSPDSQSIALEIDHYKGALEDTAITSTTIAIVDLRAGDQTPKEITDPALLAGYPAWHPTDDLIVFRTNRLDTNTKTMLDNQAPSDLYTIRPEGSGLTQVTHNKPGGVIVRAPSWVAAGRIMFSKLAGTTADEELRVIDATGNAETSATGSTVTLGEGRWRPGT